MPLARERASQLAVVLVGHAPCIELIMHFAGTWRTKAQAHNQACMKTPVLYIKRPRGTIEEEGGGTIFAMISGA